MTAEAMELQKLEDLNRYITILIVDDEEVVRESLKLALEQEQYENVWAVQSSEEALKYLQKTNILLADYDLPESELNGVGLVHLAKQKFADQIEAIVFSGKGGADARRAAIDARAAAYLEKPVRIDHIKLWINELGKRIWLQQILDNNPEEAMIISPTGTILYANKLKKEIFGDDIIGKKCFDVFEKHDLPDKMCENCLHLKAYRENQTIRTEWDYITRAPLDKFRPQRQ
ncbi:response regulator [candidate division KSB1 bacterium]|nr:response regulator [candidate division KSB1 bacterium]